MSGQSRLADLLNRYVQRARLSWDRLSQLSDVPKPTMMNWRSGNVTRPRDWQSLVKVAAALELDEFEASALLTAAKHPSIAALLTSTPIEADRRLLARWDVEKPQLGVPPPDADLVPRQMPPLPRFHLSRKPLQTAMLNQLATANRHTLVLWGPSGSGKTTLALELAYLAVDRFPDGIIWWAAHPESSVADIQAWIADSLGLPLQGRTPAQRAADLRSRLRYKQSLLIFDDLWAGPDLEALQLGSDHTWILVTTRDDKAAYRLEAASLPVPPLAEDESLALLTNWAGREIEATPLVNYLGGLPLALKLCGAQLRAGVPLEDLLANLQAERPDLTLVAMDDPETRSESLALSFDISYRRLSLANQLRFCWLGYFACTSYQATALTTIWGLDPAQTQKTLNQLRRFALLEHREGAYYLHSLLHHYARQKLLPSLIKESPIPQRHAAWHIRHALYHPGLLNIARDDGPALDQTWADIIVGVKWATQHDAPMATQAILLAHADRPALLEATGPPLLDALARYLKSCEDQLEQAVLYECLADLYLLNGEVEAGLTCFERSSKVWITLEECLAAGRTRLRMAGAHLLRQEYRLAAEEARQAQRYLEISIPITESNLAQGRRLFYWFEMVYAPLIRWAGLPEADLAGLARLAGKTGQPILEARGLSIYRSWATTRHVTRPRETRQQGRRLALKAWALWRACGRQDRADDEISFTKYRLTNRYSWRTAWRFARRRSRTTPKIDATQSALIDNAALRWWLRATEAQRTGSLSRMLPRYLAAGNGPIQPRTKIPLSPLQPGTAAYHWVDAILNISMLGEAERRFATGPERPPDHFLSGPEWRVLGGQKALPLVEPEAKGVINRYLRALEAKLE